MRERAFSRLFSGWLLAFLLLLSSAPAWAQTAGIFEGYVIVSGGSNDRYYDLNPSTTTANPDFGGGNLGSFYQNAVLRLGSQLKTYKNTGDNVSSVRLNYRLYPTGSPSGAYTAINLPFDVNIGGGGDQQWTQSANDISGVSSTSGSTISLAGKAAGSYTIEVYGDATTMNSGTQFYSNSSNNYKATLTVLAVPANLCSLALTIDNTINASATNFTSFSSAIAALNAYGVCGTTDVVFSVTNGTTYTESPAALTATGTSAANEIIFQEATSAGTNPVITAATTSSQIGTAGQDAIIRVAGADYVTFDGIDVQENAANTTPNPQVEYGYALRVASATNGAQNNTIKNCTVTLNKANTNQTYGIAVQVLNAAGVTTNQTNTTTGSNKNNVLISNTLTNMATAILLAGTSAAQADAGNEVGQTGLGNTGTNLGGNFGSMAIAVDAKGQSGLKIVGNSFTSATTGNSNGSTFHGINLSATNTGQADITGNSVTITKNATDGSTAYVIRNQSTAVTPLNINGNTLQGTFTTGSGSMYGILSANVATLNIGTVTANTIQNMNLTGGSLTCIDGGSPTTALSVENNIIQGSTHNGTIFYGIYNNASTNVPTTISTNRILNNTNITAGTNAYGIYLGTAVVSRNITISNNTIKNLTNLSGADDVYGIFDDGASPGTSPSTETISGNKIWGLTGTGNATVEGIHAYNGASAASSPVVTIQSNSVKFLTGPGTNTVTGINFSLGANGSSVTQDSVLSLSSQRAAIGILVGSTNGAATALTVSQNVVGGMTSTTTNANATPIGIQVSTTNTSDISITRNKVYNVTNTAAATAAGIVTGILVSSASTGTITVANNLVGNLSAPASNGDDIVRGIGLVGGTTVNAYYNTVYLGAITSSSTNFGTSGIYASTTPTVDLRNNLVVNLATRKGTGRAVAHRRSNTTLTTLASTTDNNLYYAGVPGANNLLYYDGTNALQTLATYKALTGLAPREANAKTENVTFLSVTSPVVVPPPGTSTTQPNFLHLDPTVLTVAESGGVAVTGQTNDYDATSVRTGYPLMSQSGGGGTAPDIGADEGDFAGYDVALVSLTQPSATQPPCYGAAESITVFVQNNANVNLVLSTSVVLTITVNVTGPNPLSFSVPFTSGTIAANSQQSFTFAGVLDLSTVGTYTFSLTADVTNTLAGLTTDIKPSNNTLSSGNVRIVMPKPVATLAGNGPFCASGSPQLTGTLTGTGPWSITYTTNGASPTVVSGISSSPFTINPAGPITSTKTYAITVLTDANGCANTAPLPAAVNVVINPRPTATLNAIAAVCDGTSATLTGTFPTGTGPWSFTYTVDGGAPISSGSIATSPFSIPTPALTYTGLPQPVLLTSLTDANCTATALPAAQNVTVRVLPTAAFNSVSSPTCASVTGQTVTGTFSNGPGPFSGTYSINGSAPQPLTVAGSTFSLSTGPLLTTSTIAIVTLSNGFCAATALPAASVTITVNPLPTATLAGNGPFCGSGAPQLTGTLTGGGPWSVTYTTNGVLPTTVMGLVGPTFTINPAGPITSTKTYAITAITDASTGCSATSFPAPVNVVVNPLPTAMLSNNGPLCSGAGGTVSIALTGNSPWTFTYTDGVTPTTVTATSTNPYTFSTGALVSSTTYSVTALADATCTALTLPSPTTVSVTTAVTWLGGTSDWFTAGNWSPACVPGPLTSATVPNVGFDPAISAATGQVLNLTLQTGATLTVSGTGNLDVYGTFTIAPTAAFTATAGTTAFVGTGAQPIPAGTYYDLAVSGATAKVLTGAPSVTHSLDLSAGSITLGATSLTMADPVAGPLTTITGAGASHYLTTNGAGRLVFTRVGTATTSTRATAFFPVGHNSYTPATLTLTGTPGGYVTVASAAVADVAPTPSVDPLGDNVVRKTWDVSLSATAAASSLAVGEGAVTLQWNESDEAVDFQRYLCRVAHYTGAEWTHYIRDFAAPTAVSAQVWSRTRLHLKSFSPFAVEDFDQPLPVELVGFDAARAGADARLTWTTASERNSRGFRVEVSTSGAASGRATTASAWRSLGFVASASANSTVAQSYEFVDREGGKVGERAYRLVAVDADGAAQAPTSARLVRFEGGVAAGAVAVPNPFSARVVVRVSAAGAGVAQLTLVDALGRVVLTQAAAVAAGTTEVALAVPAGLPVGVYSLRTVIDGQFFFQKIQKQ